MLSSSRMRSAPCDERVVASDSGCGVLKIARTNSLSARRRLPRSDSLKTPPGGAGGSPTELSTSTSPASRASPWSGTYWSDSSAPSDQPTSTARG